MPSFARKVSAYFIVNDAARAIDFYKEAFGATEVFRMTDPSDGRIGHAELRFGETLMMLADEYPDFGALSPDTVGGSPVTFHMDTASTDAALAQALSAGATMLRPATDQSFGERVAQVLDPFGHRWMLSQTIEQVTPEEMQRRWNEDMSA
ncbi:glyxoylase [Rhizobium anhuiense]|uniref:VOC family protein n=1 Tax=Rhizobium anhuiense TaxID=1184720 RepID=UPI000BE7DCB8|nr:VOC family protein [Rhizobium anhuiense]PDS39063.1 glyxoylase [Rhizobium anhuiense]PDS64407.1 glyxoylase [Rhizobium anhuiense]